MLAGARPSGPARTMDNGKDAASLPMKTPEEESVKLQRNRRLARRRVGETGAGECLRAYGGFRGDRGTRAPHGSPGVLGTLRSRKAIATSIEGRGEPLEDQRVDRLSEESQLGP
jgi:hypothetical protein